MTDLHRLLAAGDALADVLDEYPHSGAGTYDTVMLARRLSVLREWRALAREVRKEKGDEA